MDQKEEDKIIEGITSQEYKEGFVTDIRQDFIPKGLNEDIIRTISTLKDEPDWLLEFRLDAFRKWQKMEMPRWGHLELPEIDFQDTSAGRIFRPRQGRLLRISPGGSLWRTAPGGSRTRRQAR